MNRVIPGTKNAVTLLQTSRTAIIPEYVKQNIFICLYHNLVYAEIFTQLQYCIAAFIKLCVHYSIKLHSAEYVLFAREIR